MSSVSLNTGSQKLVWSYVSAGLGKAHLGRALKLHSHWPPMHAPRCRCSSSGVRPLKHHPWVIPRHSWGQKHQGRGRCNSALVHPPEPIPLWNCLYDGLEPGTFAGTQPIVGRVIVPQMSVPTVVMSLEFPVAYVFSCFFFKEDKTYGVSLASLFLSLSSPFMLSFLSVSFCFILSLFPALPPVSLKPFGIWPADPGNPG